MKRSSVALVRCDDYQAEAVHAALKRGIGLLGGLGQFVRPDERILLKPNILAGDGPNSAVSTHPAVLEACARLIGENGANTSFGDSPGMEHPLQAARHAGLLEAGARVGADYRDFSMAGSLTNTGGGLVSSFPVARAIQEYDGIINLPKAKTHQLTRLTGAVKNLFGCISGKRKALYHVRFPDVMDFSELLVELSLCLQPRLHVLDAILSMEGNGPRSGDPRPLNALVISTDPVAVDATFCRLIGLDPEFVPYIGIGRSKGLGVYAQDDIEYVGDPLSAFLCPDFKVVRKPVLGNASYAYYGWIKNLMLPKPVIQAEACVRCGLCASACPIPDKALRFAGGSRERPPTYRYADCIRCYCCLEMCPHRAIYKRTPPLGRLLNLG